MIVSRSISLDLAQRAVSAAVAHAEATSRRVCVAVVDRGGHLIASARMDGAPFQSIRLAEAKAYSVAGNGRATHDFWEWIKDDPWLVHNVGQVEGLVVLGGGVPIVVDGELVGAVGVSGESNMDEDRGIAEMAASAALGGAR